MRLRDLHRPIVSLVLFAIATNVIADEPGSDQNPTVLDRFEQADKDGDGKLSRKELPRPILFRRLDRNGDGVITKNELPDDLASLKRPNAAYTFTGDLSYGEHSLQKLDLYRPKGGKETPVMVYVHGGGWRKGDKKSIGEKAKFFCGRGWLLVSVNYRLLPDGKHPSNVNDVAKAIAWVHDHAEEHGADPNKLFVMGHSAGAHLVALASTNPAPLEKAGKSLQIVKGTVALDTNVYDLVKLMRLTSSTTYRQVFGDDEQLWTEASPALHVKPGQNVPPFLICYSRGLRARVNPERSKQANGFATVLRNAGVDAKVVDASDRSHGEINAWFGKADDEKVTGAAIAFFDEVLGR